MSVNLKTAIYGVPNTQELILC